MSTKTYRCALCGAGPLAADAVPGHMRSVHPTAERTPAARAPAARAATKVDTTRDHVDYWQAQITYWDAGSAKATTLRRDA